MTIRLHAPRLALTLLLATLNMTLSAAADEAAVRAAVVGLVPDAATAQIEPSPIVGLSEVAIGTQVLYVSNDGRYVLGGPLLRQADRANLTELRLARARRDLLAGAADVPRFRYPATSRRHVVTVVTDIDCPYCRRLHNDIPGYNALEIDVEYLMLPRAGRNTPSYFKTVQAACASDPEAAITAAMDGAPAPAVTASEPACRHPIDAHMRLARALAVSSTPSIVLGDGRLVLGHKSPGALLELIETTASAP